ncbi:MAG: heavy-metal-associated domain-containing protein [Bacilli bacterium]|nr:heavy-metal-associated domain-containing protein [Bacilli bacterium]
MKEFNFKILGMTCDGCENRVKNALKNIENVMEVKADHNTGIVTLKFNEQINIELVKETVEDIGFEYLGE